MSKPTLTAEQVNDAIVNYANKHGSQGQPSESAAPTSLRTWSAVDKALRDRGKSLRAQAAKLAPGVSLPPDLAVHFPACRTDEAACTPTRASPSSTVGKRFRSSWWPAW